jgi:cytochrome c556
MKRTMGVLVAMVLAVGIVYAQKAPQGEEYEQWMKDVRQSIRGFNNAYTDMNMANATEAIDILAETFGKMEAHWESQGKEDAVTWSKESKGHMVEAQGKMKLNDIAYALNLVELAQRNCRSCHQAYRPPAP